MLKKMDLCLCLFHLLFLSILGLTGAGQESVSFLNLHDTTEELMSVTGHPIGVSVSADELSEVSSSVLKAESWLRTHVLAHYPATQITTIVVGDTVLCQKDQEHILGLVLPAMKNVHHSLVRWGLQREIKVSAAFSPSCLLDDGVYRVDLAEKVIKPLLQFLHITNSTYSVSLHPKVSSLSDGSARLVSSHLESMKKLGFLELMNKIKVLVSTPNLKQRKPISRKLSSMDDSKTINPYPARPTPLGEIPQTSPIHSSIGFSVPANVAKNPLPPMAQEASPPPFYFPTAPDMAPAYAPAASPYGYSLPPCNPVDNFAPAPQTGMLQKLWCVAKPSVPPETLQEAIDYACGEGGGDCEEITPPGNCYHPDTVVAHASYAFNSYWQKNKRNGGTCNFGGTAMLINADPSFLHCRFILS